MANNTTLAISSYFLDSFAALPKHIQVKVAGFVNKFRINPTAPGINYEKLTACHDQKLYSVRIDDTYRGIVVRQPETGVYLLLWVDHHDAAYEWAKNKKCEVNPKTGSIQVYDMVVSTRTITETPDTMLFSQYTDKQLTDLGLPEDQLSFVRSIETEKEFYDKKDSFPLDAYENLSWLVEGIPLSEVMDLMAQNNTSEDTAEITDNLAAALDSPETMKSFVIVEGEDELRRIMAEPLEKWRVFLHPVQRTIVNKNFSGPARVLGGAGTGKTVVAMHRAKQLASKLKDNERILFTTYTANLASDIKDNLRKICTYEEQRRIEVINLDAWVSQFLRLHEYSARIIYDEDELKKIWEEAAVLNDAECEYPAEFYADEYNRVVVTQEAFSQDKYIKASRVGRGVRLDRGKRIKIWKVFETYLNILKERQIRDINTAMYECRLILSKYDSKINYRHVIVDEGQDLSANGFRLIRAIAGEEHENDIFIVGDAHQRIYKNKASLSQCGINIRGRSSILRINYRTTEEIRKQAFALLKGIAFDDLDDAVDTGDKCQSLTHGRAPQIRKFSNAAEEFNAVLAEIKNLISSGVSAENICVVARTHKLLDAYIEDFTANGIRCYEIRKSKNDDRGLDGIRVATMHRIKGLEFQYVFVVSANKDVIPLSAAIDNTNAVSYQETMTAERCLLYVALTRAQKGAYISGYGKMSEFLVTK